MNLLKQLGDFDSNEVKLYASYITKLMTAKKRGGELRNPWAKHVPEEQWVEYFRKVKATGLTIDGDSVTIQSTGISFDYQAYKNRMLQAYPDSTIDLALVYDGDNFAFSKVDGRVKYQHDMLNPFNHTDDKIIGGYVVIRNRRGEFVTHLSKQEIEKRRRVAKSDDIWKKWYPEMCLKTIAKRAFSFHFKDEFQEMEAIDNEQYDLENRTPLEPVQNNDINVLSRQVAEALKGHPNAEFYYDMLKEKRSADELTVELLSNTLEEIRKEAISE